MADSLSRWRGKQISLIYANPNYAPVSAKMADVDTAGVVIDLPDGRTFIPFVHILHIVGPRDG